MVSAGKNDLCFYFSLSSAFVASATASGCFLIHTSFTTGYPFSVSAKFGATATSGSLRIPYFRKSTPVRVPPGPMAFL